MSSRMILSGLRSIEETIRTNPDRVSKLLVPEGKPNQRVMQITNLAKQNGIRVEPNPKRDGEEGVLAVLHDFDYADFSDVVEEMQVEISAGNRPIVLLLDGITDPQNLGAIIRTSAFMGVKSILIPKDRAALLGDTVYRVASGGLEYVRICQVTNLVSSIKSLKDIGFWTVGFSEHASQDLAEIRKDFPMALIVGNEEKGIRPLVKESCDFLVKLSPQGQLKSLNASVAAALALAWATDLF